jgi:hypothetical protein
VEKHFSGSITCVVTCGHFLMIPLAVCMFFSGRFGCFSLGFFSHGFSCQCCDGDRLWAKVEVYERVSPSSSVPCGCRKATHQVSVLMCLNSAAAIRDEVRSVRNTMDGWVSRCTVGVWNG